jgi:hypothetical protein
VEAPTVKLFLSFSEADRLIRRGHWHCLGGLVLLVAAVSLLRDFGFVSGLMLVLGGGMAASFRFWLRERGLWMLAVLALVAYVPLYVMIQYDALKQHLNAPRAVPWWAAVDAAVAAAIVWRTVRLLATVARVNRRIMGVIRVVPQTDGNEPQ